MPRDDTSDRDDERAAVAEDTVGETSPTDLTEAAQTAEASEVDILRAELEKARSEATDFRDRFLRARADLENYRRRASGDVQRARESGLDSAILPLLSVYDDLGRALGVATDDPAKLIPGIQGVRDGLKRNLETLGMAEVGSKGEPFNPDLHEALTAIPTGNAEAANTIAEVVQVGFVKDERLVRPARVVVYQG
jgi:molecular chaperone GrpE